MNLSIEKKTLMDLDLSPKTIKKQNTPVFVLSNRKVKSQSWGKVTIETNLKGSLINLITNVRLWHKTNLMITLGKKCMHFIFTTHNVAWITSSVSIKTFSLKTASNQNMHPCLIHVFCQQRQLLHYNRLK